jgi:hypothetical protein
MFPGMFLRTFQAMKIQITPLGLDTHKCSPVAQYTLGTNPDYLTTNPDYLTNPDCL